MKTFNELKTTAKDFVVKNKKPLTIAGIALAALATGGAAIALTAKKRQSEETNVEELLDETPEDQN